MARGWPLVTGKPQHWAKRLLVFAKDIDSVIQSRDISRLSSNTHSYDLAGLRYMLRLLVSP